MKSEKLFDIGDDFHKPVKTRKPNLIAALLYVSESELKKVPVLWNRYKLARSTNSIESIKQILFNLGADTSREILEQKIMHKNRFNEIVTCIRYVTHERTDSEWVNSGYASQALLDKVQGNKLLENLYRMRLETEDAMTSHDDKEAQAAGFEVVLEAVRKEYEAKEKVGV